MSKLTQPIPILRHRPLESERRVCPRQACELQAAWRPFSGTSIASHSAAIRDISTTGIGLVLDSPCLQTLIVVTPYGVTGEAGYAKMLRVKHCAPDGEGHWLLGGVFAKALTEDELDWLLHTDRWI